MLCGPFFHGRSHAFQTRMQQVQLALQGFVNQPELAAGLRMIRRAVDVRCRQYPRAVQRNGATWSGRGGNAKPDILSASVSPGSNTVQPKASWDANRGEHSRLANLP